MDYSPSDWKLTFFNITIDKCGLCRKNLGLALAAEAAARGNRSETGQIGSFRDDMSYYLLDWARFIQHKLSRFMYVLGRFLHFLGPF